MRLLWPLLHACPCAGGSAGDSGDAGNRGILGMVGGSGAVGKGGYSGHYACSDCGRLWDANVHFPAKAAMGTLWLDGGAFDRASDYRILHSPLCLLAHGRLYLG